MKKLLIAATAAAAALPGLAFDNVDFTTVAEKTVNSVVSIKSYVTTHPNQRNAQQFDPFFGDPFFEYFFGGRRPDTRRQQPQQQEPQERQSGLGSGVIIDGEGFIVTNNHVIKDADRLEVTLNDNRSFDATVVGTDPTTDLAVIRIEADSLQAIAMGNSDRLRLGEWVVAVGNPFGFTSSVTAGIVSAKGRNISSVSGSASGGIEAFIQTDAALNPGNSGGALVNLQGELVGINAAIYSQTGNYAGTSFAIPTTIVSKVVDDIRRYGSVQRAMLGIRFGELTPQLAKEKGITATAAGIYVGAVTDGSAAAEAGIQEGDVIVAINGTHTTTSGALQEAIARQRPGDTIDISLVRDNRLITIPVTLLNTSGSTAITRQGDVAELGCTFAPVDEATCRELKIPSGLQVKEVTDGGLFKRAGIRPGFIIVDINNSYVTRADDVRQLYESITASTDYDHVMFVTGVYPGSSRKVYYAVDLLPE